MRTEATTIVVLVAVVGLFDRAIGEPWETWPEARTTWRIMDDSLAQKLTAVVDERMELALHEQQEPSNEGAEVYENAEYQEEYKHRKALANTFQTLLKNPNRLCANHAVQLRLENLAEAKDITKFWFHFRQLMYALVWLNNVDTEYKKCADPNANSCISRKIYNSIFYLTAKRFCARSSVGFDMSSPKFIASLSFFGEAGLDAHKQPRDWKSGKGNNNAASKYLSDAAATTGNSQQKPTWADTYNYYYNYILGKKAQP